MTGGVSNAAVLSENARRWLELLLRERVLGDLDLRMEESGTFELRLRGAPGRIRFPAVDPALRNGSDVAECGFWDCSREGLSSPLGAPLPAPGSDPLPELVVRQSPEGYDIAYDLHGLLYWVLTRSEEVASSTTDRHGRFPATASHAFRFGYLDRPFVDEWLAVLGAIAQRTWPGVEPRRRAFNIFTSHDVDFPSRYAHCSIRQFARTIAKDVLVERDLAAAFRGLRIRSMSRANRLDARDPYNTFDWIMRESEEVGIRSTFFFICGGRTPFDPGYDPRHPAIRRLMQEMHARGHIIGLHPSYECIDSSDALQEQAEVLRRAAREAGVEQADGFGARMHYLRWRWPKVLHLMEQAGMSYDATLGYADRTGFRAGTAIPYRAFDPVADRMSELRLRPLVVMEGTLYAKDYMGLTDADAQIRHVRELKARCRAVGGEFSVLWHNSEFLTAGARKVYVDAIAPLEG